MEEMNKRRNEGRSKPICEKRKKKEKEKKKQEKKNEKEGKDQLEK